MASYTGGGANYFLSFGIDPYPLIPFGNYGVVLNFIFFAYAIFHYRFLDIDEVVEKIRATRLATLGTMAASLNHEIKNPLYVIRGRAETFLSKWDEGYYKKEDPNKVLAAAVNAFQIIQEQVNRISQITENILGFVRSSRSNLQEINLEESINRALSVFGYYSKAEGIKLVKKIEPNLPTIKAEAQAIEEIIFNLIANAQQAIKRDGTIQIEAGRKDDVLQIRVSDTGPGIPREVRDRLFEPFSTSREDGHGLGLYITKQLVERNKGKIYYETSSAGTQFIVDLGLHNP